MHILRTQNHKERQKVLAKIMDILRGHDIQVQISSTMIVITPLEDLSEIGAHSNGNGRPKKKLREMSRQELKEYRRDTYKWGTRTRRPRPVMNAAEVRSHASSA